MAEPNIELAITAEATKAIRSLTSLTNALTKLDTVNLGGLKKVVNTLERLSKIDFGNLNRISEPAEKASSQFTAARSAADRFADEVENANHHLADMNYQTGLMTGQWEKLARSFIRIAFYRTVRRIIAITARAFREGRDNLVRYSQEANRVMSDFMNVGQQIQNTLGVTFMSVMRALHPLIMLIANAIIEVANGINMMIAALSGQRTFMRAIRQNEDYAASLEAVNAQLFSFDRFNVLSNAASEPPILFEKVEISEGMTTQAAILLGILTAMVAPKIIAGLAALAGGFKAMATGAGLATVAANLLWTVGLAGLIAGVILLITHWDNLDTGMRIVAITLLAIGAALLIVTKYLMAKVAAAKVATVAQMAENAAVTKHVVVTKSQAGAILASKSATAAMIPITKTNTVVTTASAAASTKAAVATGAWKSALTLGIAAAAIVGGIVAITAAINSATRSTPPVQAFARGGTIEDGLFTMSHGEITGQFNDGTTFVANQQQGQEGLRQAAYEGFLTALESYGGLSGGGRDYDPIPVSQSGLYELVRREREKREGRW